MYKIEIKGLFGDRDVLFRFQKPLLILIGENGIGKSTVLGIMNCILDRNLEGLKEYDFSAIHFSIYEREYILNREDLNEIVGLEEFNNIIMEVTNDKMYIRELARELEMPVSRIEMFIKERDFERITYRKSAIQSRGIDTPLLDRFILKVEDEKYKDHPIVKSFIDPIRTEFMGELLYFPTYRRVEEEAIKLGQMVERDLGKNVIKFGMQDVKNIFESIKTLIKNETINGVQDVMDSLFTDLLSELNLSNGYDSNDLKNKREDLEIILQRSENSLPFSMKETLQRIDVILDKEDLTDKEQFILYFITKYLKIYETSKVHDEKINTFIKVCNSYFKDKKFIYDLKKVDIKLVSKYDPSREIQLKGLSSGEKQIVSLFAKLYLTGKEEYVVLFDEPELSLSIEWQEKLINDILQTNKCKFMLAVTHSPFIVPKDAKKYTLSFGSTVQRKGEIISG